MWFDRNSVRLGADVRSPVDTASNAWSMLMAFREAKNVVLLAAGRRLVIMLYGVFLMWGV